MFMCIHTQYRCMYMYMYYVYIHIYICIYIYIYTLSKVAEIVAAGTKAPTSPWLEFKQGIGTIRSFNNFRV